MTHPFYQERQLYWPDGSHGTSTGQFDGISELIQVCREVGAPVNFFSTDAAGIISAEIVPIQPNDAVGFRFTSRPEVGDMDRLPVKDGQYVGDPIVSFDRNYDLTDQYYPPELRPYRHQIYHTYVNEPNTYTDNNEAHEHDIDYLATGFLHLAKRSLADNRRYAFAGWAGGNPHEDFWYHPKTEELLRLAAENPDMIAVNWHLYSLDPNSLLTSFDYMIGRYRQMYKACEHFGIPPLFILSGESGTTEAHINISIEKAKQEMAIVQQRFIEDRFWGSWHWWTLGEWGGNVVQWTMDYRPHSTEIIRNYEPVTIPEIGEPPVTKPKIVIVKKPQIHNMTLQENTRVSNWAFENYGRTATHSHDDMLTMLAAGNRESYAVIWWAERQPDVIQMLEDAGYRYELMPEQSDWYILNVPHMSQRGEGAEARYNDCGAAAVAMVVNGQTDNAPTVNEVAIKYQNPPNEYMNFWQLDQALNGYGMNGIHKRPYYSKGISDTILDGKAVIALVSNQSLPYQFDTFDGGHFIVIYGFNNRIGNFLYRDPLAHDDTPLEIAELSLEFAMKDAQDFGNQPSQAMDCEVKPSTGIKYKTADFMIPDPRSWVVVDRGANGNEDIFTIFRGNVEERVKNHQQKEVYVWRVNPATGQKEPFRLLDTSPANDSQGNERVYKQFTNGVQGGQIAPAEAEIGKVYTYQSYVQFYAKNGCAELSENSGNATSTFQLIARHENYTFANGFHVDVLWETIQTGELQLYAEKDGVQMGWCGGGASQSNNEWAAMPIEFYTDRAIQPVPPDYC